MERAVCRTLFLRHFRCKSVRCIFVHQTTTPVLVSREFSLWLYRLSMDITSLSSVKPGKYTYYIRVRICRTWRAIRYAAEQYSGLHCVMIDQEGGSIHGFMPEDQVEDMIEKPIQGQIYEIHQFSTRQHSFGLKMCVVASNRFDRPIRSLSKHRIDMESSARLFLRILKETLTVVFWGKLAREFNVRVITSLPSPVIAVFTGLKMTVQPFCKPGDKPMILGDFHVFQTTETNDPVSVQTLTGLNPADYKGTSVLCKGQIIKIGTQGWWYRQCAERGCYKQCFKLEEFNGKYRCKTHGLQSAIPCFRVNLFLGDEVSDVNVTVMGNQAEQLFGFKLEALRSKRVYVTEQIVPPEISTVIGQVHVFELKGNTYGEWVAIGIQPSGDTISMTPSVTDTTTTSATQISEAESQPLNKSNTTTASDAQIGSHIPDKTNTTTSSSTLISDIELQTPKKVDTTTTSDTPASEIELHTPNKACLQPKRTAKNISKTLFPES